jgi:hypothetical protein
MRKPRTTILLLTAILVTVGFNGQTWLVGTPKQTAVYALDREKASTRALLFQRVTVITEKASVAADKAPASAAISPAAMPQSLSDDATALVAAMCDLQLLAHDTPLTLNSRQWSALAAVVLRNQAIRQTYEARIATSKVIAPGQYRVEIPVYASAGDVLRGKFHTDLRMELGEATAAEVLAKLGDRLEGRFAGFGVSVQTLDITANPSGSFSDIQVTRTVTYWNSVEGGDRLTTRRETHFPAWEDPTGDSWGALLAMVKA